MTEVRIEVVYRPVANPDRLTTSLRELIWRTVTEEGRRVRRTLIDGESGEILDDVWLCEDGRVRSYETSRRRDLDAPNRGEPAGVEAVVAAPGGADHEVIENSGDDRVLAAEVEVGPALP